MPRLNTNRPVPRLDLPESIQTVPLSDMVHYGPTMPINELIDQARQWQPVRILRHASSRGPGEVEACKALVQFILDRLDVSLPPGVIAWKGKPGRPPSKTTMEIYDKWLELGEPRLGGPTLARAYFGKQKYRDAGSDGQKRLIDQCRTAVLRTRKTLPEPD